MEQQQQHDYNEQHQQQQVDQLAQEQLTSSPRRFKPPIDIDAALRLQSQASYVQEPARQPAQTTSSSISKQQQFAFNSTSLLDITSLSAASAAAAAAVPTARLGLKKPMLHHQNATNNHCYYDQNYHYNNHLKYNNNNSHNISVDYIDCLSNNDLAGVTARNLIGADARLAGLVATTTTPTTTTTTKTLTCQSDSVVGGGGGAVAAASVATTMRGIPSCRKHLSRFHRTHRIDPAEAAAPAQANDSTPSQAQPLVVTSQPSNEHSMPTSTTMTAIDNNQPEQQQQQQQQRLRLSRESTGDSSGSMMTGSGGGGGGAGSNVQQQQGATGSVLYPISVSDVKKRTYFIGSVSQDSLLSHDELYRYFPSGRVSIFVCTWNQNRKRAPMNLNDLLLPDQLIYMPDIYAIGIQEAFSSQQDYLRDWEIELQTTLGPSHVLLHSCSLGVLHLSLFIRRDLIWFCSVPEESLYNSRSMPTNMIKTKGAVSVAFRFFGTSFMFTNCHFPAHENRVKDRIDEYQRIINSIDLPKNLKLLKPRYLSNDSTARFDCVFFMGDLNFRLEHRTFDETIQILDDIFQAKEQTYEALTQNDQLLKVMETQQAFHGFDESQIKFPPTYKFLAQTNRYDRQTKRVPSYTDRILFRSKRQRHIQCLIYDWLPQLVSSDHKPVYCLFDVLIRPGQEQNIVGSLNAGLFQRTVYLEALKRRAEDPDGIRESGASGNLICSIS